jgi:hypothetical protein
MKPIHKIILIWIAITGIATILVLIFGAKQFWVRFVILYPFVFASVEKTKSIWKKAKIQI